VGLSPKDARRAEFKRYKEDVKKEGKPFFPYAIFHDTVMALVTVIVIIGLAAVFTSGEEAADSGILGPRYHEEADPGTTQFIPRPDWYFYFLFYLLRIFKWPESVVLGTVGIPTILLILLIGLPFYDRRRERRPSRRPVAMVTAIIVMLSMATLTWKGATAKESLGSELIEAGTTAEWARAQGFEGDASAEAGAKIFAQSGCLNCHTYLGEGNANLGAPDLTEVGLRRDAAELKAYIENPAAFGNNVMISYSYLGEENLTNLSNFLAASKGPDAAAESGE
jgi:menaquinol-cytochrome c reductase cytochrome b/c subunit